MVCVGRWRGGFESCGEGVVEALNEWLAYGSNLIITSLQLTKKVSLHTVLIYVCEVYQL
jgi:hypothetical protein